MVALSDGYEQMWCPCSFAVKSNTVMLPLPRSPSALLYCHTPPQKTLGGPAHLVLSIMGWCLRIADGGILPETTIVVSHSNKSAPAFSYPYLSFGWLNHACYQRCLDSVVTRDGEFTRYFRSTNAYLPYHPKHIIGNRILSVRFHFDDTQVEVLQSVLE